MQQEQKANSHAAVIIKEKIRAAIPDIFNIYIDDDSAAHSAHYEGDALDGVTHMRIVVVTDFFLGKRQLERHKLLNKILEEEFKRIHSISIAPFTVEEFKARIS